MVKKNLGLASAFFNRLRKIEKHRLAIKEAQKKNKEILRKNPWIGNMLGMANKSTAEGSDSSAFFTSSDEEQKMPKKQK